MDFVPIGCYRLVQTKYAWSAGQLRIEGVQGSYAGGLGGGAAVFAALYVEH
jgi:hypothetical protein